MALKYYFEFTDVEKIKHKVEIYNDDFVGDATLVYGTCSLTKASTKDTLEPIRGGGLKIDLEASTDLDFTDLYSEEERTFSVKYYRNENLHSLYWIDPEGLFQSFVEDKWIISLDCTDGLGFLNNLSYVDNVTKEKFSGKQSQLEVIVNCLKRTGFTQNIYVRVNIFWEGLSIFTNVLENTYVDSFRYIKDDTNTTMQCNEVLKTILEIYGLIITQRNGDWYICKPNEMYDNNSIIFYKYDSDGVALSPSFESIDLSVNLGSQKDNFYPHHVNGNQQLSIDNSIGAFRINYKYGLVKSFFNNIFLTSSGSPAIIDEWTISSYPNLSFPSNNQGVFIDNVPNGDNVLVMTSDNFTLDSNEIIDFKISFSVITGLNVIALRPKVILTDGVTTYYLNQDGVWNNSVDDVFLSLNSNTSPTLFTYTITSGTTPIAGDIYIELNTPVGNGAAEVFIAECNFSPSGQNLTDEKGEIHTFQRISKPSSKIAETKEVLNGDLPSEIYSGTIYKNDNDTPTEKWFRGSDLTRLVPILRIMGEERMKMYAKPLKVFKGDVYGYIDYLSLVNINNITGKFMPIEWSYNASKNITSIKLKEILNEDLDNADFDDISYNSTLDTGTVVNPTITN